MSVMMHSSVSLLLRDKEHPLTDGLNLNSGFSGRLQTPYWSLVQIPKTWTQFFLAIYLANFHVAAILGISTYIKPNI